MPEMIATREDVLGELKWQKRLASLGASSEVRERALEETSVLQEMLCAIDEQTLREKAAAGAARKRWLVLSWLLLCSVVVGATFDHVVLPVLLALAHQHR